MPETDAGWYAGVDQDDVESLSARIKTGTADAPKHWPRLAIEQGFCSDEQTYIDVLNQAARTAALEAVSAREEADDQQVIHAVRAIDDLDRTSNELAERVREWGRTTDLPAASSRDEVITLADAVPSTPIEAEIVAIATTIEALHTRRASLVSTVERTMHAIAPNLAAMAGPILGARLIALAGGLEDLAKMPSSTLQVLGAEDALFAHLRGEAPSPKHGIIFTHEYVRGTRPAERGSAARAVAGKFAIAARVDHYAGDHRPALEDELQTRIERIRGRSA